MGVMQHIIFCLAVFGAAVSMTVQNMKISETRYEPNWKSLDSRPLPTWYDESKIGIFLHWGVFSVPSYEGAWFWWFWKGPTPYKPIVDWMNYNYRSDFQYADFADQFTAEFYYPDHWAELFNASGAKYVVLTTKHHEGYCNWNTKYSFNWNSMDVGPKRDLAGELATAVRKRGLKFGAYHSLFEWFHPLYVQDKKNNFKTQDFVRDKSMPELYELVNNYKPDVIWSDGDWEAPPEYWNSTNFLAWLYNDSPVKDTVVTNDRWGNGTACLHGGFLVCEDKYKPDKKAARKYEDATTMDRSAWAYRRNMGPSEVLSMEEVVALIAQVVSTGGNLLINVGPTKDGVIIPIFEERLRQMGQWLGVNGEGIYKTKPWTFINETVNPNVWYTSIASGDHDTTVYAIVLKWPDSPILSLTRPVTSSGTVVTLLGYPDVFKWAPQNPTTKSGIDIAIPVIAEGKMPCQWGWVFKMTHIYN